MPMAEGFGRNCIRQPVLRSMASTPPVALALGAAHAQTDNPAAAAIGRDTDNLVVAAIAGDLVAVNRLLESGADVNQRLMASIGIRTSRCRRATWTSYKRW